MRNGQKIVKKKKKKSKALSSYMQFMKACGLILPGSQSASQLDFEPLLVPCNLGKKPKANTIL